MKDLRLTDGSTVSVDDEDFWRFWKQRLSSYPSGIVYFKQDGKVFLLHREVMGIRDKRIVVHLNGDRRNCQRDNLLVQDRATLVRARPGRGSSPYKGVSRYRKQYWQATIRVDGKLKWLGSFDDAAEAARAYDEAARVHHGPTALLNFPTRRRRRPKQEAAG